MTSEPTTGEVAFELRNMNPKHLIVKGNGVTVEDVAADRLESQDKQIAELSSNCDCIMEAFMSICTVAFKMSAKSAEKDTIINELTACAESAEAERDAAIERLNNAMRGVEGIKRGLPQEGEGV